jgi:hypothetical protein
MSNPVGMLTKFIHGNSDHFGIPFFKLRFQSRGSAQLSGNNRGKIGGVRENNPPGIAENQ